MKLFLGNIVTHFDLKNGHLSAVLTLSLFNIKPILAEKKDIYSSGHTNLHPQPSFSQL